MADIVLRREGRDILWLQEDTGEWVVLAKIPDYLTPEEWEWLYRDGPLVEGDRG